ncbi:MAG TPA: YIP1 family protein [Thermoanaerobaculia bacterium]
MTDPYVPPEGPAPPGGSAGALATSPWGRPLGVLVSPQPTFRSLAERPSWLPPLVILLLLVVAGQLLAVPKIDMEAAVREALERQNQPVNDEQVEQMAAMQSKFAVACSIPLFAVGLVVAALLVWGLANAAGGEIGFVRSFAVTLHGLMPNAVASLLSIPVILGLQEIDPGEAQRGLLASHLAAFAPEDTSAWLLALLARIDVFAIWSLVLLVIGLRTVGRLSTAAATGVVLVVWLLWVGFNVGTAAMGWAG